MRHEEAEKLLGGHATGTLTGAERRTLYEAALEHQDLFDTLADEEALRELLADPAARAHLLGALAPRVVPFWRRPGILGMAAGLLVAGLAGLAVLHGPGEVRAPRSEAPRPAPQGQATVPEVQTPGPSLQAPAAAPARKVAPPVREKAAPAPLPAANQGFEAPAALAPGGAAEARDAKRAEERVKAEDARKAQADGARAGAAVLEVMPSAPAPTAPAAGLFRAAVAEAAPEPAWGVSTRADGSLRVTVLALPAQPVLLLRRGAAGVAVVRPLAEGREGPRIRWRIEFRPVPGEALDLYILNAPVADPARLPAEGPVDGFRTRIPVPEKKAPAP
ncbi:MAG TPA: hypothetical protein VJ570_03750 [Holophagaceae bacterium]|nr:hypothetical protein [Holophagaceae bacterium]